jgi:glycosyltransferase involved in cell wall biosynthesis
MKTKKLLSIGHSYIVNLNRRLVNEMAHLGRNEWEITTVAPIFIHGDLRPLTLAQDAEDVTRLRAINLYLSQCPHAMFYGSELREILHDSWDLVHCWQEPYVLAGGQVAAWVPKNTLLVYRTAQSYSKNYPIPFNWLEQYSMNHASAWICSGKLVERALKPRLGYTIPMKRIPLGVDTVYFHPNAAMGSKILRSLDWEDHIPVIGYLGRFVPEKGLHLLMQALDQIQLPWRALFVGTGPMEAELKQWAKPYGDRVRICTDVNHDDVPIYLNAMDMLCAPSQTARNWREQFGRMLVEAFACGVPVIGSDSGEIPYVIGDSGIVVGEKDTQGWINAISDLLDNSDKRADLAARGLERAKTKFSWKTGVVI